MNADASALDRLVSKIQFTETCWLFEGAGVSGERGYGLFLANGRCQPAHRVAYQLLVGSIPEGLTLDHLCRVRACVNPDHLEPVPNRTNVLRGVGITAENAKKTHCPHGHAYSATNTYVDRRGSRHCRTCRNTKTRARRWQGNLPNYLRTECPKGHAYAGDNLYIDPTGRRICRACGRAKTAARAAARKAA